MPLERCVNSTESCTSTDRLRSPIMMLESASLVSLKPLTTTFCNNTDACIYSTKKMPMNTAETTAISTVRYMNTSAADMATISW